MPGAAGDGIANDTDAINRTIQAGGIVYFPPGKYRYIGQMTVPVTVPPKSYRFYGDGPGVSLILFETDATHSVAGINAPNMDANTTLNVDGLTLAAKSEHCGTAIYAAFSESGDNFRTATIHNVQIVREARQDGPGYWTKGIDLLKAKNTVIDKVEISGLYPETQTGIAWRSSNTYKTTGLQATNLEIKFLQKALETSGWVEGVYLTGFELVFCSLQGVPVVDLAADAPGGVQPSTFHLVNGHVQGLGDGVRLRNLTGVKISKVHFLHNAAPISGCSMVEVINSTDVVVSQCSFVGANTIIGDPPPPPLPLENGILLNNAHSVRIAENSFTAMSSTQGNSIVVPGDSNAVRITNNLFGNFIGTGGVLRPYADKGPDTYFRGNNRDP
ncbi:MAG: hypothetical protein QOC70_2188 [Verrucomicrobiota bacterium]|jgi:hypothetical protein